MRFFCFIASLMYVFASTSLAKVPQDNIVAFAGGKGESAFRHIHVLSNGDLLIAGSATSFDWLPANVKKTELPLGAINSADPASIGFLLLLSPDGQTVKAALHFPANTVADISRIRTTEIPGQPTGVIYISGRRTVSEDKLSKEDGYFIARLEGNFVDKPVSGTAWAINVKAGPRNAGGFKGTAAYKEIQPWDVGSDGRVIYGTGADYDFDWASIEAVNAKGEPMLMPGWPAQEGGKSFIAMKAGRSGSLRSMTQEDFDFRTTDENGNPGRKGKFPDDYYFQAPGKGGPGYTGYRSTNKPTQRVGQIAIDRRNNHLYFGYSTQSKLPDGNPDFEPAIVAMDDTGKLLWWARGYKEIERTPADGKGNQDGQNSPPDQYCDAVAIDYKNDRLVTLMRCHGNGVINYWSGDQITANPGAQSFQKSFTGKNGNIHISWIGKYGLSDGKIYNATYMAEFNEGAKTQGELTGLLEGWPNPNSGWPDVNSTRAVEELSIGPDGSPLVIAKGRRPFTTTNAQMQMLKPAEGKSAWSAFARTYAPDLSTITYSTILRGPWDAETGKDAGNEVDILHAAFAGQKLILVGQHRRKEAGTPSDLPTQNVPAWASKTDPGPTSALIAIVER